MERKKKTKARLCLGGSPKKGKWWLCLMFEGGGLRLGLRRVREDERRFRFENGRSLMELECYREMAETRLEGGWV